MNSSMRLRLIFVMAGTVLLLEAFTSIGTQIPNYAFFIVCFAGSIAFFGLEGYERSEQKLKDEIDDNKPPISLRHYTRLPPIGRGRDHTDHYN